MKNLIFELSDMGFDYKKTLQTGFNLTVKCRTPIEVCLARKSRVEELLKRAQYLD